MSICRGCAATETHRVLDLGRVPATDYFPTADELTSATDPVPPLRMQLCAKCGLAQLHNDIGVGDEPRGVEPQTLSDQAVAALGCASSAGWLNGGTVREFGSPHGGTWLPLLKERGFSEAESADVVLDCFGIMHDADQRAALELRARATAPGGVLLLQFHSLMAMVTQGQWNALRHGHIAYYSLTALTRLLASVGMRVATAWTFDLYGGTIMIAAVHGRAEADDRVSRILESEREFGITDPSVVGRLQYASECETRCLRGWLVAQEAAQRTVYGYGAASRAATRFAVAGVDRGHIAAVADASPAKQGRMMPGTDIPIISPDQLIAADPDCVLITIPEIEVEVRRSYPQLDSRWHVAAVSELAAR